MIDTAPSSAQTLRILLTGAPGAGKGTQAERIAKALDIVTISSGQLLRTHIAENTEIGALAKVAVEKGELISDDIMVSMIQDEIRRVSGRNWLLDGFPRTVGQAQLLEQVIAQDPTLESVNLVVNLVVPEEVIIERITERYVHIPSGRTYHTVYSPPKVAMIDDVTGEPLTKRSDDTVEVVQKRLDTYHKMTRPVLDYYREKDIVVDFYGETSDVIFPQIMDHLAGNFEEAMSKQIEARL
ncbi:adenylate kinase [Ramicandelaber brevisporus]|nr:adenylate kinase [Ramicandelaber brevisporus]